MKTLFYKELRENLKLAVPFFLLLTAFCMFAAWDGGGNLLLGAEILRMIILGCAGAGAALGWLQIHHERPRDLWAFLVHRPITRTQIFLAKISAGLLLYFLAIGLPLLGYVVWISAPGHLSAPFEWGMAVPGIGCVLLGTLWYFGAMLASLRDARWYVSRGMGLAAALPLHALTLKAPGLLLFWQFELGIAFQAAVMALAVWGSFQTGGSFRGQPSLGKATLAGVVGLGMTVVVLLAILFLAAVFHTNSDGFYAVTKTGAVFHVATRDNQPAVITDLSGARLKDPKTGVDMEEEEFNRHVARRLNGVQVNFGNPPPLMAYNLQDPRDFFYEPWRTADGIRWYWTRQGRLAGYELRTHRFVGILGAHGTNANPASAEWFLRPAWAGNQITPRTLATSSNVYEVDLRNRAVKPVVTVAPGDRIGGTMDISENATIIVTKQFIQLVDAGGRTQWQLPHDPEYREPRLVNVFPLEATNQYVLWTFPPRLQSQKLEEKISRQMVRIGGSDVGPRIDLKSPNPPRPGDERLDWAISFFVPPEFPFIKPLLLSAAISHVPIQWHLVEFATVSAGLCAVAGWLIGRRYGLPVRSQVGWALFHLVAGFPGFLAFLCVREWPARELCPNCQRLRTVDREQCEHCGGGFAPPERKGSEIFEVAGTV